MKDLSSMYTRGQFAIIGKVGRKALRLYHEEGLLVPATVSAENGYHYYEEDQLAVLEKIKRLRKLGLSLYEIKQVLDGKAPEAELVRSKIREMDGRLQELRELTGASRDGTNATVEGKTGSSAGSMAVDDEPDVRPFGNYQCLFIDENVELEDLGMSVGKLYERASRSGIAVAGSHFVQYAGLSDSGDFTMRTCLPVRDYEGKGMDASSITDVSEKACLHLHFTGGFSRVGNAHIRIKEYADSHKLHLSDRAYEVYNKDMSVDVFHALT